jgi:hypothetical protein
LLAAKNDFCTLKAHPGQDLTNHYNETIFDDFKVFKGPKAQYCILRNIQFTVCCLFAGISYHAGAFPETPIQQRAENQSRFSSLRPTGCWTT